LRRNSETKRLEILKEAVPGIKRVGVLWNSANPLNATPQVTAIAEAARALGIEIEMGAACNRDGLASAFEKFKARQASAITTVADAMLFAERQRIVELTTAAQLPGVFPDRQFADAGGLLFYGPASASYSLRVPAPQGIRSVSNSEASTEIKNLRQGTAGGFGG
jgi:putative ABC transport system substrate-binding protein